MIWRGVAGWLGLRGHLGLSVRGRSRRSLSGESGWESLGADKVHLQTNATVVNAKEPIYSFSHSRKHHEEQRKSLHTKPMTARPSSSPYPALVIRLAYSLSPSARVANAKVIDIAAYKWGA